ncbi:hypothetical protein D9756_005133 [Leucocoprinus leucothites]|uniref:F-box domain-containing protein n=1 Tax=Leucocoprinus leucothites TaxID=201217 RepID=A0A8H5LKK8_9AGAR|nr:hypothetical protein D9756_005133 [Leucoagaricus leucothites]
MDQGSRPLQIPYDLLETFFHYAAARRSVRLRTMSLVCRVWRRLGQQALFSLIRIDPLEDNHIFQTQTPVSDYVKDIYLVDHCHTPVQSVLPSELPRLQNFAHFMSTLRSPRSLHIAHPRLTQWEDLPESALPHILELLRRPLFEMLVVHSVLRCLPIVLLTHGVRAQNVVIGNVQCGPKPEGLLATTLCPVQSPSLTSLEIIGNHGISTLVSYCESNNQTAKLFFKNVRHLTLHYTVSKVASWDSSRMASFLRTFEMPFTLRIYSSRSSEPASQEISRTRHAVDSLEHLEIILQLGKILESKIAQRALRDISPFLVELTSPSSLTTLSLQCHASIDGPPTHKGILKQILDLGRSISAALANYHKLEEVSLAVRFRVSFDDQYSMEGSYPGVFAGLDLPRTIATCTIQTHSDQEIYFPLSRGVPEHIFDRMRR